MGTEHAMPEDATAGQIRFDRVSPDGGSQQIDRYVATEMPLAFEFNCIGYAVLMGSPSDVGDLVIGFAFSERLITRRQDIIGFDRHDTEQGVILRVQLADECAARVLDRVRHRVSESSCGLCGIENLAQAMRPLPDAAKAPKVADAAMFRALDNLNARQPHNRATGAMHAAALCSAKGEILIVREDVGRHNAFDKLVGAMLASDQGWEGGFALLSSRCSYDLIEKAVLARCPLLVTISAPTDLAIRRARDAGLGLAVLARPDAILRLPAQSE